MTRAEQLSLQIVDKRSRTVVFVSHCLLNPNTRYLGGAADPDAGRAFVRRIEDTGTGIVQMPCPEQCAWGGVAKRFFLLAYGSRGSLLYAARGIALPSFILYTRLRYAALARQQARQIADYARSGVRVAGIVAVDGSPSCGLAVTLDIKKAFCLHAEADLSGIDAAQANRMVIESRAAGQGLYTSALQRQLRRRGLSVQWSAYDLIGEIRAGDG